MTLRGFSLAVAALVGAGCASQTDLPRVQADVHGFRSEITALRAELAAADRARAQTAADLAHLLEGMKTVESRTQELSSSARETASEMTRLRERLDAADEAIRVSRTLIEPPPAPPPKPPERAPREPAPRVDSPEQTYAAALTTWRGGEHGQAVLELLDFIGRYPRHPLASNARYWIGEAYYAQRDYRQALVEFEKVLEHGVTNKGPEALLKIGFCRRELREAGLAQRAWERVVREYPGSEAAVKARALLRGAGVSSR